MVRRHVHWTDEAWLAINTTIWRTLSYPLAALRLSKAQWEEIMAPILRYGLPAMGICRNFSRHLTFSDISLFGLGFKHLFTMQEITRIKDVIQHAWENTLTGKLYRASFELFFIKVGIGPNLLDIPEHALFLATDSLVCSTVQFLQEFHISLQHDILLPPQRQYDSLIMDTLSQLQITQDELFDCNCCHLYLRALYLSDIVTGDGLEIAENAWSGVRDVYFRANSWPHWPKPFNAKWKVWHRCLCTAFCARGRRLRQPLGYWLIDDPDWPWFTTSDYSVLYQRRNHQWTAHNLLVHRQRLPAFQSTGHPCDPPSREIHRTSVHLSKLKLLCSGFSPLRITSQASNTLPEWLREAPSSWCTQVISQVHNGEYIAQSIKEGWAIAVSDGSYKEGYGTASWIIQNEEGRSIEGNVVCPGLVDGMSSNRSELAGLYTIAFVTLQICNFFHIFRWHYYCWM